MSEKHADIEFGVESRAGIPFHFLMRDVIQFDNSLEDAIRYVIGGVVPAGHYLLRPMTLQAYPGGSQDLLHMARSWRWKYESVQTL